MQVGQKKLLLIPTSVLASQLDQRIVWTVGADCRVSVTPIETGDSYGDQTAVESGLKPGVRIAADHLQRLNQGLCVGVREGDDAAAALDDAQGAAQAAPPVEKANTAAR